MKYLTPTLSLLSCLLPISVEAKDSNAGRDRRPVPSIEEAVKLVREFHDKGPHLKPIFIDHAVFERGRAESVWKIGVRYENQETGQLVYSVARDGTVKVDAVVKDR